LAQQQAQREAFKYEQQNERLNYQGSIADIEAEIEKAQLELSVNEELMGLGVASKIELQRAKLTVRQESPSV
jgi:multidrug resistance efflux pump